MTSTRVGQVAFVDASGAWLDGCPLRAARIVAKQRGPGEWEVSRRDVLGGALASRLGRVVRLADGRCDVRPAPWLNVQAVPPPARSLDDAVAVLVLLYEQRRSSC